MWNYPRNRRMSLGFILGFLAAFLFALAVSGHFTKDDVPKPYHVYSGTVLSKAGEPESCQKHHGIKEESFDSWRKRAAKLQQLP
jgi:hypothetical protein